MTTARAHKLLLLLVLEVGVHEVCEGVLGSAVILHLQLPPVPALVKHLPDVLSQLVHEPAEELVGVLHLVTRELTVNLER